MFCVFPGKINNSGTARSLINCAVSNSSSGVVITRFFSHFWPMANALIEREIQFLDDHGSHCFVVYKCEWGCIGPGLSLGWLKAGLALALCWAFIGS